VHTRLITAAVILLVPLAGLAWFFSFLWFPGITPKQSAWILMQDDKLGGRALGMCHVWGDWALEPLREASNDFNALHVHNSRRLAEVLTRNNSKRSIALAEELHQHDKLQARLVGAVALAAHGRLPNAEFLPGGEIHSVLTDARYLYSHRPDEKRTYAIDNAPLLLALMASGNARSHESLPAILALIEEQPLPYEIHVHAAEALASIEDPRAVPVLENAMRSPEFYALADGFRALVALHDPQAVPLAIARIEPEMEKHNPSLVRELEEVTGQRFGFDRARWTEWWETQGIAETSTVAVD